MTINVNCPPRGLFIGHETENVARALTVDFSAWAAEYSTGTLQILFQPPGAERPYAVVLTRDGTTATWKPSETDLAEAGTGAVQIIYTVEDVRVKTSIIPVMVEPSLGVETDPPEGWTSWIDQLTDLAAVTEQHAANAAESARNAAASATDAQRYATDAEDAKNASVAAAEAAAASASHYPQIVNGVWYVWSPSAGAYISTGIDAQGDDGVSPTVEITAIQGGHRVVITDAEGPHTFDVLDGVTPDLSAYRTATEQDVIDDAQDEELNNLKSALNEKAGILRDTASGSVASFVPDATVPNLLGLSVALEPIQDLHGYDRPWPAGGRKNLIVPIDRTFIDNGVPCVCSSAEETVSLKGTATSNGGRTSKMTIDVVLPAGTYYFSVLAVEGTRQATYIVNRTDNNQYLVGYNGAFTLDEETAVYVGANVLIDTTYDEVVHLQIESGSTATAWTPYSNICPISGWDSVEVNHSGADTSDPTTYTIPLGDTVYGGTLDVTNGTMTVDRAMVDLGTLTWRMSQQVGLFYTPNIGNAAPSSATVTNKTLCSKYPVVPQQPTPPDKSLYISYPSGLIYVRDEDYSDYTSFTSAMSGVQLCYELATPTPISTTPTEISTVDGQNNVFSPDGDVTVEYAADLKTYIDQKIAAAVAAMS